MKKVYIKPIVNIIDMDAEERILSGSNIPQDARHFSDEDAGHSIWTQDNWNY